MLGFLISLERRLQLKHNSGCYGISEGMVQYCTEPRMLYHPIIISTSTVVHLVLNRYRCTIIFGVNCNVCIIAGTRSTGTLLRTDTVSFSNTADVVIICVTLCTADTLPVVGSAV